MQIAEGDGLPPLACISCITEVLQATKTRKRIIECHEKLIGIIMNDTENSKMNFIENKLGTKNSKDWNDICEGSKEINTHETSHIHDQLSNLKMKTEEVNGFSDVTHDQLNIENHVNIVEIDEISEGEPDHEIEKSDHKLTENLKVKMEENRFICAECGEMFGQDAYAFKLHRAKHKNSQCNICGIVIRSVNMKKHIESHTGESSICELCGAVCKSLSLRSHIYYMHEQPADKFKCDQCSRSFRRKFRLVQHKMKAHTGRKE